MPPYDISAVRTNGMQHTATFHWLYNLMWLVGILIMSVGETCLHGCYFFVTGIQQLD